MMKARLQFAGLDSQWTASATEYQCPFVSIFKPRSCAQFATGYFWPCEQCFKNLHPGANLLLPSRWCKFICTRVQIVHMNANCIISIHFDLRFP